MGALLRWYSSEEFEDGVTHGGQGRLRWWPVDSFFPFCGREPAMLEEDVRDHCHEGMTVEALPGSALEVIKTEYPDSSKTSLELSFRAGAPTDGTPYSVGQHVFGRYR